MPKPTATGTVGARGRAGNDRGQAIGETPDRSPVVPVSDTV